MSLRIGMDRGGVGAPCRRPQPERPPVEVSPVRFPGVWIRLSGPIASEAVSSSPVSASTIGGDALAPYQTPSDKGRAHFGRWSGLLVERSIGLIALLVVGSVAALATENAVSESCGFRS